MPYNDVQQMMLLAYAADTELTKLTGDDTADAQTLATALTGTVLPAINSGAGTNWTLSWGPYVKTEPFSFGWANMHWYPSLEYRIVNTMFMATDGNRTCIAIAGTDFRSLYDWLFEDLSVLELKPWSDLYPQTKAPASAMVSDAMHKGFSNLQNATPATTILGAGTTMTDVLNGITASGSEVYVTGHSLGGALAPIVSLWIADQQASQGLYPNFTVNPFSYAGPTPGEANFQKYYGNVLPNTQRVWNRLDIVPNAWNQTTLGQIQFAYNNMPQSPTVHIQPDSIENAALTKAAQVGGSHGYVSVIPGAAPLPGASFDLTQPSFASEVFYQHINSYPLLLGVPAPPVIADVPSGGM